MKNEKGGRRPFNLFIPLERKSIFDTTENVLYCGHNAGFFSNCTVTLWNLVELYKSGYPLVNRIDFSRAFDPYKGDTEVSRAFDLYPYLFRLGHPVPPPPKGDLEYVNHHGIYKLTNLRAQLPLIRRYFQLSEPTLRIQRELMERYEPDFSRTISVVYRGTDKGKEVVVADPEQYLTEARALLQRNPDHRVLIQTDDLHTRDLFMDRLGDKCFFFEEMPVTNGPRAIHYLDETVLQMSKTRFAQLLLAVVDLLSRSRHIVNHTGNMALWVCLFRGNAENVTQFDRSGARVVP